MPQIKHDNDWILTANQNYTPTGIFQLGQILTKSADLNSAIFAERAIPLPEHAFKGEPEQIPSQVG